MEIKLGDLVEDRISGFVGVVIARAEWLYGCVRYAVAPRVLHNGDVITERWFDEPQIDVIERDTVRQRGHVMAPAAGGPRRDPTR